MAPIDWYYARDNKQHGPVGAAELKRLSQTGELRPDDLVWREGMDEWMQARKVKGLFEDEPASPKMAIPPPPKAASPVLATPPSITPPVAPAGSSSTTPSTPIAFPATTPSTPFGGSPGPPVSQTPAAPIAAPTIAPPASAPAVSAPAGKAWHPLDLVLAVIRGQCGPAFVDASTALFVFAGQFGLYGAVVATLVSFGALGAKLGNLDLAVEGVWMALLLVVLQYAAVRFMPVIDRLARASGGAVTSSALLDSLAVLAMSVGLAALVTFTLAALRIKDYEEILAGVFAFAVCLYAGLAALNPGSLGISIVASHTASDEGLGVFAFLLKLGLRIAPVAFGVGVATKLGLLLIVCYRIFSAEKGSLPSPSVATAATVGLMYSAAVPIVAYFVYLVYHLVFDALRSLISLPGKLDRMYGEGEESPATPTRFPGR